jgi:Na+/phosphate symporter
MHPVAHVLDSVIVISTTLATIASSMLLAQSGDAVAGSQEMQLFLLPLIGALITSGGCIMLNPNPDTRRITIGRGIFALFFGVLLPQVIGMFHPSLASLAVKPVMLVLIGGLVSALAYVLSKPFTREMYARADRVAKIQADNLERKYAAPVNEPKANAEEPRP